jgi:hypothetical protein
MPFLSAIAGVATAAAGAISAGFSAISAFSIGGFAVGKAFLQVGLALGLQAVSGALSSRQQGPKPGAIQAAVQIGGDIPRQVQMGSTASPGQLAYGHNYGAGNAAQQMVILLSDGWCGPISRIRVNDVTAEINGGGVATGNKATGLIELTPTHGEVQRLGVTGFGVGGAAGISEPSLIVQYYDGRPGQPAPSGLIANSQVAASKVGTLDATDRYAGMAYVVVTLWRAAGNFDAIPELLFEFGGYRCYDPRFDSTTGGAGPQRRDNPATWTPSNNPAVQIYNYLLGVQAEGQMFMGVQAAPWDIMAGMFIAAANICDELVTLDGGGAEPRYRSALLIVASEADHRTQLAPLIQAMAGYLVERGGMYGVIAGAAQLPVATITDDDIIWARGVEWSASKSRVSRLNEVHGQFTDPNAGWQANSYPPERSAGDLAYDGERLATSLDLVAVQSVSQAQRIARIRRRETRREATASLSLGFHYCWLDAGDWIAWNCQQFGSNKTYRIMTRDLNPDDTVSLGLQEVGNEIYSWTAADERPYIPPPTPPADGPLAQTVQNFAVQADVVADRSIVRATWTPVTDTRIVAVIIEYRAVGSTQATRVRDDSPADGVYIIDQPPTGADYEYRASIVTVPPRLTAWTAWVPLAALATYRPGSINITALEQDLADKIAGVGPGTLPGLQAQADDFRRALSPDEATRALAAEPVLSDIRREIDQLYGVLGVLTERFELLRAANIEAGLEIQSEEGRARIFGLAVLTTDVGRRFNEVSLSLSALDARITLIASTVVDGNFDGLVDEVANIGVELDALQASLSQYVTTASLSPTLLEVTSLRQDMTAANAAIVQRATQTALDALATRTTSAEQTISALGSIIQSVSAVTQAAEIDLQNRTLADVLAILSANRDATIGEFASATNSLNARIDEQGVALSSASQRLVALTQYAAAGFQSEREARASASEALTTALESLTAVVNNPVTGLVATKAQIDSFQSAQATTNAAVAGSLTTLTSQVGAAQATANQGVQTAANANAAAAQINLGLSSVFGQNGNMAGVTARFSSYASAGATEAGFQLLAFNTINSVTYNVGMTAYAGPNGRGIRLGGDGAVTEIVGRQLFISDPSVNGGQQVPVFDVVGNSFVFNPQSGIRVSDTPRVNIAAASNNTGPAPAGVVPPLWDQAFPANSHGVQVVASVTVNNVPAGAVILLQLQGLFFAQWGNSLANIVQLRIYRNGTEINFGAFSGQPCEVRGVFLSDDVPSAGNYTYELRMAAGRAGQGGPSFDYVRGWTAGRFMAVFLRL